MAKKKLFLPLLLLNTCFLLLMLIWPHSASGQMIIRFATTKVSFESYGQTYYNSTLRYGITYNGSIHIFVYNATPPYTFVLANPYQSQNSGNFDNIAPGNYSFHVTDATGQAVDTTLTVGSIYPQPSVVLSNITAPSDCNKADGGFTLVGSGGKTPYTYSIDGGVTFTTNNTFTNLRQGYYPLLLLKDANGFLAATGCGSKPDSSNYFPVDLCPFAVSSDLLHATACSDTGAATVAAVGGSPPFEFSQDGINYFPGILTVVQGVSEYTYAFNNLAPGLHFLYAKDATGTTAVTTVPVMKQCMIAIEYVSQKADCHQKNGILTVSAAGGNPPYVYSLDGNIFQQSNVFTGLGWGFYNIFVKDSDGLISSSLATVNDNCPNISVLNSDVACGQNNGLITATSYGGARPFQFSIDGGIFQTDSLFTGLGPGNYKIAVKDYNGYVSSTTVSLDTFNCLRVSATTTSQGCYNKNGSVTAIAHGGVQPWQYAINGSNFQSNNIFTGLDSGTYTVTVKDANAFTNTATASVGNVFGPTITNVAITTASCQNTGGGIAVAIAGGTAPFKYSIDGKNYQDSGIFTNDTAGMYVVLVKDTLTCVATDTVQVTKLPTPAAYVGTDTVLCNGQTIVLNAPAGAQYQYQWQDGSTGSAYTVTNTGIYWLKVTNQFGCTNADTVHIRFRPLPVFNLGNDTILCNRQALKLTVPIPNATYLWSTGSTLPAINITLPGEYRLVVTDSSCVYADSIGVNFKQLPEIALGRDTTLCAGQTLVLNALNNNATYLWQDSSTLPTYTVTGPGYYTVTVTANGCDTTGMITVAYITKPVINIGPDTTICTIDKLVLNATYPQTTYLWQDGSTQPTYTVKQAGVYAVYATNTCGTVDASVNVKTEDCACKFFMPTAFTPNGDNKNDVFKPVYKCFLSKYQLRVFNRFGQNIYSTQNVDSGWDGTLNGVQQPPGAYVWEIEYFDTLKAETIKINGTIVLVR